MTADAENPFGARAAGPGLLLRERPPVEFERRDERAALDAILAAATSSGTAPERREAGAPSAGPWYHTIELPGGVVTDGVYDHRPLVPHYGLPDDLTGRTALDAGTADGFCAFELERRGAEVTRVRRIRGSAFDLDPAESGSFDIVHCGDLLVHLERPLEALRRLRAVTAGEALIADVVSLQPGTLIEYRGGWEAASWWRSAPSTGSTCATVRDPGEPSSRPDPDW